MTVYDILDDFDEATDTERLIEVVEEYNEDHNTNHDPQRVIKQWRIRKEQDSRLKEPEE